MTYNIVFLYCGSISLDLIKIITVNNNTDFAILSNLSLPKHSPYTNTVQTLYTAGV